MTGKWFNWNFFMGAIILLLFGIGWNWYVYYASATPEEWENYQASLRIVNISLIIFFAACVFCLFSSTPS